MNAKRTLGSLSIAALIVGLGIGCNRGQTAPTLEKAQPTNIVEKVTSPSESEDEKKPSDEGEEGWTPKKIGGTGGGPAATNDPIADAGAAPTTPAAPPAKKPSSTPSTPKPAPKGGDAGPKTAPTTWTPPWTYGDAGATWSPSWPFPAPSTSTTADPKPAPAPSTTPSSAPTSTMPWPFPPPAGG